MDENMKTALALSDAFSLLAILTEIPDENLVAGVEDGSLIADMMALSDELKLEGDPAALLRSWETIPDHDDLLWQLRREYTRLFNHPEHPLIPLYEEFFLSNADFSTRLFINPASLDADREYRQAGLRQENLRSMPADAMPVQMAFMAQLYERLAGAYDGGDVESAQSTQESINEFTRIHLKKWMKLFYGRCADISDDPVYRSMGRFGSSLADLLAKNDL